MAWEIDWGHPSSTGTYVWARNPASHQARSRAWHSVATGYLRSVGVQTATYRSDSWEIDWERRNGKLVWARNGASKMPSARDWHWIDFHTLNRAGIKWRPKKARTGKTLNKYGYVLLYRTGLTDADIELANKHGLWLGASKAFLAEHRLVALKKYGELPAGSVVRHINGIKTDNRPENLILGTIQENTMDHNTARLMAMFWREMYLRSIDLKRVVA